MFLKFSALLDEATAHRRNAGIRAGGNLPGHLRFAKHFPGGLASTPGAFRNGKLVARSLGNALAALKTDRPHIYKGFWATVPGTLQICSDSGLRISPCKNGYNLACGPRGGTLGTPSEQKTAFQKILSTSKAFFLDLFALDDVVTKHRKYGANLLGEPLRSNLCFSDVEQKCARVLFCTCRRGHGTR